MKRYAFALQRVKRVRSVEEELAKAQFGAAEVSARTAEERAEQCHAAVVSAVDDLRGLQGSPRLEPRAVIVALGLIDDARRVWFDAQELAHVARARAEELRRAWQARKRDVDGLERLDERARADWALERDREEARALDDTAIERKARAQRVAAAANSTRPAGEGPESVMGPSTSQRLQAGTGADQPQITRANRLGGSS